MKKASKRRIPSLFKKPYTRKKLEKKVLRHLHIPSDRAFIEGCFEKTEDTNKKGEPLYRFYPPSEKEPKEQKKQLKRIPKLAKEIKKNRGIISLPKAGLLFFVLILIAGGFYLFRNTLIQRGVTAGLEEIFQAKAELEGVNLQLFKASLIFDRLAVADRDRPMRNLFETGPAVVDLDMISLLKGSVIINKVEVTGVSWDTERKTSGALPEKEESGGGEVPFPLNPSEEAEFILDTLDPLSILEKEYNALSSVQSLSSLEKRFTASLKNEIVQFETEVRDLDSSVQKVLRIDPNSIGTIKEIEAAYGTINNLNSSIDSLKVRGTRLLENTEASLSAGREALRDLEKSISSDLERLKDLVDLSAEDIGNIMKGIAEDYVLSRFKTIYSLLQKGLRIAERIEEMGKEKKPGVERPLRAAGRTIPFPKRAIPAFFLKDAGFSAYKDHTEAEGRVRGVSSHPEISDTLMDIQFTFTNPGLVSQGSLSFDLRERRSYDASLLLSIAQEGISIFPGGEGAAGPVLGITEFSGTLKAETKTAFLPDGSVEGDLSAALADIITQTTVSSAAGTSESLSMGNPIFRAVQSVFTNTESLDLTAEYSFGPNTPLFFSMDSTLDEKLRKAVVSALEEQEAFYRKKLEEEFYAAIEGPRKEVEKYIEDLASLKEEVRGEVAALNAYKKELEAKRRDLENRAKSFAAEKGKSVLEKAKESLPKVPSF